MNFPNNTPIRGTFAAAILAVAALLTACHDRTDAPSAIDAAPAPITRLDRLVAEGPDESPALVKYLQMMGYEAGDPAAAADSLRRTQAFAIFAPDVETRLGDLAPVEARLGRVNALLERDLGIAPHTFHGIVSPYRQQVIVADSLTFIALNHYLGADYPGYEGMPAYLRAAKTTDRIPADVAEALIALQYPYERAADATVLNRLLYEGALTRAAADAAGMSLADFLGWTDEQMADVARNEGKIWAQMAGRQLIYSADPTVEERLVSPQPATNILSDALPPRAGRYIGARIVEAYLDRFPDTASADLLSPAFYNDPQTLILSAYSPR